MDKLSKHREWSDLFWIDLELLIGDWHHLVILTCWRPGGSPGRGRAPPWPSLACTVSWHYVICTTVRRVIGTVTVTALLVWLFQVLFHKHGTVALTLRSLSAGAEASRNLLTQAELNREPSGGLRRRHWNHVLCIISGKLGRGRQPWRRRPWWWQSQRRASDALRTSNSCELEGRTGRRRDGNQQAWGFEPCPGQGKKQWSRDHPMDVPRNAHAPQC